MVNKSFYLGGGFYIRSGFLKRLFKTCCVLGLYKGLAEFFFGHLGMYLHNKKMCDIKHKIIKNFLREKYPLNSEVANKICSEVISGKSLAPKERIWFFWSQGVDSMPEVVKLCYNCVIKNNNSEGREVVLLTIDNVNEYIQFPSYVGEALSDGRMTLTHYSDLLRMALLYYYGGMWLDATNYVPNKIDSNFFNMKLWTIKGYPYNWFHLGRGRWSLSAWGTNKPREELFRLMLAGFLLYHRNEKYLVDYLLIDYILDIVYDDFPEVRKELDQIECNNEDTNRLYEMINEPYDVIEFGKILKKTNVFKLSYKYPLLKMINGKPTYYGYLCDLWLK